MIRAICVTASIPAALYNIVDQIFIANASYLGSYGNAANTVVFPLTVVAIAIAVMIGDGCCTFGGSPRFAMATLLLSAILNILVPICIYVLHWGMAGAAISACCRCPV